MSQTVSPAQIVLREIRDQLAERLSGVKLSDESLAERIRRLHAAVSNLNSKTETQIPLVNQIEERLRRVEFHLMTSSDNVS